MVTAALANGEQYVGKTVKVPARFWGTDWARQVHGAQYKTLSYNKVITGYKAPAKKKKQRSASVQEWTFEWEVLVCIRLYT